MTVLEVLGSCVQRINEIRLPVAEAVSTLQLAGVADDIQACINTLAAHANDSAAPEEDKGTEQPEEVVAEDTQAGAVAQEDAENEQKAGEEHDEHPDV